MKNIIDKLLELQKLRSDPKAPSATAQSLEQMVRAKVPKPILAHFDRLIAQGKTGVAMVRHGVCQGCHLQICSGTAAGLAHQDDIHICDNCGRYLYLAPEGSEPAPVEAPAKPRKARKTTRTALVPA